MEGSVGNDPGTPEIRTGIAIERLVAEGKLMKVEPSQSSRYDVGGHFHHDQDRLRMILEAIADDPETEQRATGAQPLLNELAEVLWEFVDDLDMEITGDAPSQGPVEKGKALRRRLRDLVLETTAEFDQDLLKEGD